MNIIINQIFLKTATLFVIGWYLTLITHHFMDQRPLWNDELCVFRNINQDTLDHLFQGSLISDQEFPRVYLYLIGILSNQHNGQLQWLRSLPFIAMFLAFLIWLYLGKKSLKRDFSMLIFTLCWAASIPLIYYASELKHYSMDVLVSSLFLLFLYHQSQIKKGLLYSIILILLALTGFFSYIAFIWMLLLLFNLIKFSKDNKDQLGFSVMFLIAMLMVFGGVYQIDFSNAHKDLLKVYWKDYFLSFESAGDFFRSFQEITNNLISRWFAERPKWIRMASRLFIGAGFVFMIWQGIRAIREKGFYFKTVKDVSVVVLCIGFILSTLNLLPWGVTRLSLFFAPIVLLMTVQATEWLYEKNQFVYRIVVYPFVAYLVYVAIGITGVVLNGHLGAQSEIW